MKLTTAQTAERLEISDRHVRRLITEGVLPADREGKEWMIEEEAILLYQEGTTKKIKEAMDRLAQYSNYIVANPADIAKLQQKNVPIDSKFISYDEYLDKLFKEKKAYAEKKIEELPLLDEKVANPVAYALYSEFRECFVLGVNGAAITLAIILLEHAMKQRLLDEKRKINPQAGWKSVEGLLFSATIEQLGNDKGGPLTETEKQRLLEFGTKIRNRYLHYKIRQLIESSELVLEELPSININTGEVTIHYNVKALDMPQLWFSAKKVLDERTVRDIARFCIKWTNAFLTH